MNTFFYTYGSFFPTPVVDRRLGVRQPPSRLVQHLVDQGSGRFAFGAWQLLIPSGQGEATGRRSNCTTDP